VIVVNGERRLQAASIAELLELLGVPQPARGVAVAVDGEVVPRSAWDGFALPADSRVEVVGATQGG
jgi:sulfur carrier protein